MTRMGGTKVDLTGSTIGTTADFENSKTVIAGLAAIEGSNPEYLTRMFLQRAGLKEDGLPNTETAGSVYGSFTPSQLKSRFSEASWVSYEHPAILPQCKAFMAQIPGRLGIVDLDSLPVDTIVTLDDRKGTGKVSATVKGILGPEVDFTIAILGPNQSTGVFELWTFHPGAPVAPSIVEVQGRHGHQISVEEAKSLGFGKAKIVSA